MLIELNSLKIVYKLYWPIYVKKEGCLVDIRAASNLSIKGITQGSGSAMQGKEGRMFIRIKDKTE